MMKSNYLFIILHLKWAFPIKKVWQRNQILKIKESRVTKKLHLSKKLLA